jgi:hypothetical protein
MELNILEPVGARLGNDWKRLSRSGARAKPPVQKYIVGHLPDDAGTFGLIIGSDGSRKSWLGVEIAVAVATGTQVAGGLWPAPERGRVVYFTVEDSATEMWRRLHLIGNLPGNDAVFEEDGMLDVVPLNAGEDGIRLDDLRRFLNREVDGPRLDSVEQVIEFCTGARLIIFDPLADMMGGSENDDIAAKILVDALREIGRKTGAGILVVHHQSKSAMMSGEKGNQTARGSSKVPAAARWSVTLQVLSETVAGEYGICDRERWTTVTESKSSYTMLDTSGSCLYHWPVRDSENGEQIDGVPLMRELEEMRVGRKNATGKKAVQSEAASGEFLSFPTIPDQVLFGEAF